MENKSETPDDENTSDSAPEAPISTALELTTNDEDSLLAKRSPSVWRGRLLHAAAVSIPLAIVLALAIDFGIHYFEAAEEHAVVIIGGGVAGLMTANALLESGMSPSDIVVLEMRDRIGGRLLNAPVDGFPDGHIEMGATFVGPTQAAILALSHNLSLSLFDTFLRFPGLSSPAPSPQFEPALAALISRPAVQDALERFDQLAKSVPLAAPWDAPNATALDATSLEEWINSNSNSTAATDLGTILREATGGAPSDVSLLYALFHWRSTNGLYTIGMRPGEIDRRYTEGSAALPSMLAARLTAAGVAVRLRCNVSKIAIDTPNASTGATLTLLQGPSSLSHGGGGSAMWPSIIRARRVVVATGSGDAGRISYRGLSAAKATQLSWWSYHGDLCAAVVYPNASWRAEPLLEVPAKCDDEQALRWGSGRLLDYSPPSGVPGILRLFGHPRGNTTAQRRANLEATVCECLGVCVPALQYVEQFWDLNHDGGTANGRMLFRPGQFTSAAARAWRAPDGPLHWGGADTGEVWVGNMDAAVTSGVRCAREVVEALKA